MKVVSVKLPEELVEQLDFLSVVLGVNRSTIIRVAIEQYIDKYYRELITRHYIFQENKIELLQG